MSDISFICPTCGAALPKAVKGESVECKGCGLSVLPLLATKPIAKPIKLPSKKKKKKDEKYEPLLNTVDETPLRTVLMIGGRVVIGLGILMSIILIIFPRLPVNVGSRPGTAWLIAIAILIAGVLLLVAKWQMEKQAADRIEK